MTTTIDIKNYLSNVVANNYVEVVSFSKIDDNIIRLMVLGMLEGVVIKVVRTFGDLMEIDMNAQRYALSKKVVESIQVKIIPRLPHHMHVVHPQLH